MFYVEESVYAQELQNIEDVNEFWKRLLVLTEIDKAYRTSRLEDMLKIKDNINNYVRITPDFSKVKVESHQYI